MSCKKLYEEIEEYVKDSAGNEKIEGAVIGGGDEELTPKYHEQPRGKLIPWSEAAKWLDYDVALYTTFSSGLEDDENCMKCNSVIAWTQNWIIFVDYTYEWHFVYLRRLPRNPIDFYPPEIE